VDNTFLIHTVVGSKVQAQQQGDLGARASKPTFCTVACNTCVLFAANCCSSEVADVHAQFCVYEFQAKHKPTAVLDCCGCIICVLRR
jgi:hypothetical protein